MRRGCWCTLVSRGLGDSRGTNSIAAMTPASDSIKVTHNPTPHPSFPSPSMSHPVARFCAFEAELGQLSRSLITALWEAIDCVQKAKMGERYSSGGIRADQ